MDLTVFCGDGSERLVGEAWKQVDLNLTASGYERVLKEGMTVRVDVSVTSRAQYARVVVYDFASGLTGTAVVRVPLKDAYTSPSTRAEGRG